jgi:glycosyltransferase 2 family protein
VGDTEIVAEPAPTGRPEPQPPGAPAAHPWRSRLITAARVLAAAAIVYFVVATTVRQWGHVRRTFDALSWPAVLLSLLAVLLAIATTALAWREALDDLGHRVPVRAAAQVFLVGQLGKYLPGSVWSYLLQMELGRRAGIPRARAFLASLTATGLGITVGLLIGAFGLRGTLDAARGSQHAAATRVAFYAAVVLLPIAVVCAHPAVLTRLVQLLLRLLRRPPLTTPLTWRGVLGTAGWSAVGYVFFGVHLWLLARTQATPGWSGLAVCIGSIGLAIAVSTVVVIAPSGIGVRELIIAIALGGFGVPFGTGYALALVSRLIVTVADVLAAGVAAVVGVRRLRHAGQPAGDPATQASAR